MLAISRGHERIIECVQRVFPDAKNVICIDSLLTYDKIASFRNDGRLVDLIEHAVEGLSENDQMLYRKIIWRTHTLIWAAQHALSLDGDFAEFGVFHGYSADVVARYIDLGAYPSKTWWLYDTFEGIAPDQLNRTAKNAYLYEAYKDPTLYDYVAARFSDLPNVRVVKGRIPEVLDGSGPERLAFLHIDMNSAVAERDGLAAVFDRLVPGAAVVFDDYGRIAYQENHDLLRAFLDAHGQTVLEVPTGQGMFIKR
jgi:hypothetical protein